MKQLTGILISQGLRYVLEVGGGRGPGADPENLQGRGYSKSGAPRVRGPYLPPLFNARISAANFRRPFFHFLLEKWQKMKF